jgi:hypothetical protein
MVGATTGTVAARPAGARSWNRAVALAGRQQIPVVMQRVRSVLSTVLIVLSGILVPIGVVAAWADTTIYDSATFSRRAVQLLDSTSVRRELAERLTEQLARSGNEQAIAFRPAAILAVEAVVDTDTFRSIFRTAIRPDPRIAR